MTGLPDFNRAAFNEAAHKLRERGLIVLNPAEIDGGSVNESWDFYMRKALTLVLEASSLECLPGWEKSRGARIEVQLALDLGIFVYRGAEAIYRVPPIPEEQESSESILEEADRLVSGDRNESILEEADRLVSGDRNEAYGHPFDDFTRTGKLWAPILDLEEVTPEQVALCMAALKISRLTHKFKRDSAVDLAGYAKCLSLVAAVREE